MLIDSHAHLGLYKGQKEQDLVIRRAFDRDNGGLSAIVTVGIDVPSSRQAVEFAQSHDNIYAVIGVHPHDAKKVTDETLSVIRGLAEGNEKVVGIGETGLDFYRNLSPEDLQRRAFSDFLYLSGALDLPVIIHDRDAHDDVLDTLKSHQRHFTPGIIHCFSGDWEYAKKCMDMGFYISVSGVVTYPKAHQLHDVVKRLPADRLIFETDSPFLSPVPYRGKRNEPAYVRYVALASAKLRGDDPEELMDVSAKNTMEVFKISDFQG